MKRFTFTRRPKQKPDAESPSGVSGAAPTPNASPAPNVNKAYIPVSKPDAIAQLCFPTGDEQLDYLHVILIDLVQKDLIGVVRTENDPTLRYFATQTGKEYVETHFKQTIEALLGRIFGDQ